MIKVGISGYTGRVGQILVKELLSGDWANLTLSGGYALKGSNHASIPVFKSLDDLLEQSDCVIDFSGPENTRALLSAVKVQKKPVVIGTTGLSQEIKEVMADAAKFCPVLYAANMSVGVNLLLALVEQAAARLDAKDWDIEIFESHHHHKTDAPSGTALALGESARKGRGDGDFVTDRNGKRKTGDIGYAVSRGGDVVGEHTVTFYAAGERLELGHRATDRALFARGALRAAQWLSAKPAGLYGMKDVLDLESPVKF